MVTNNKASDMKKNLVKKWSDFKTGDHYWMLELIKGKWTLTLGITNENSSTDSRQGPLFLEEEDGLQYCYNGKHETVDKVNFSGSPHPINLLDKFKPTLSREEAQDLAVTTAEIYSGIITDEGDEVFLLERIGKVIEIAEAFCKKYPLGTDWSKTPKVWSDSVYYFHKEYMKEDK